MIVLHTRVPRDTAGLGLITSVIFVVSYDSHAVTMLSTNLTSPMQSGSSTCTSISTVVSVRHTTVGVDTTYLNHNWHVHERHDEVADYCCETLKVCNREEHSYADPTEGA